MSGSTDLYLPPSFPYPVKIVSIDANSPTSIQRGTRLLSYSFVHLPSTPSAPPETRFGTWDSTIEGTIDKWNFKPGDVISERRARDKPVVSVIEPCKHGVQIGGLCGLCGKDMTDYDYTGFSDASRASIQMTHSAFGPTVSLEEAQKIERETADHLLKSRKLSLIVDLDQTIVHATVDPTVGEWISEGESWEAKQVIKASSSKEDPDDSDDTSSESDDECNPNWEALKDVKKFRLGPESFGAPSRSSHKGKGKLIENEGCMYYIKPRPGWQEFMRKTAAKYEMHVYTMGTRAYAEQVCAAIDPDGKIFGGRLLSRDESGSLTQKSLQRLFPCDTSMVVIIDDRADVWEWSPNLIKVIPYDFFVGIGDINSTFLPKVESLTPAPSPPSSPSGSPPPRASLPGQRSSETALPTTTPPSPEEADRADLTTKAMLTRNSLALEAQVEERPLAKKQEELLVATEEKPTPDEQRSNADRIPTPDSEVKEDNLSTPPKSDRVIRKALLKNDDAELERVNKLLEEVHTQFFHAYDARIEQKLGKGHKRPSSKRPAYDVTKIIPQIREKTLAGVHILFSSVIPLDTRPESAEIWRMAHMFGAQCSTELTSDITHVVAAKRGTVKVDAARRRGGIKIVWLSWFTDSIALWRHQEETPYLLDDPAITTLASSPLVDPSQISSDPDPDADDWDQDPLVEENKDPNSFELDAIDWNDINDEVEAAMNESDDDEDDDDNDTRSDRSGLQSGNVSDDNLTDESNSSVTASRQRLKRKRLRSLTPSEISQNGSLRDYALLRSPLAKRKKLAADRTGASKLKEGITADDLTSKAADSVNERSTPARTTPAIDEEIEEDNDGDDGDDEEDEEEDDFLARELEEELG